MEKILITPNEAAKILGVAPDEIRRWCHNDKDFPCFKVGAHFKISRDRLQDWIDKKCLRDEAI